GAGVVAGGLLVSQFAALGVIDQFNENPLADLRVTIVTTTIDAGKSFQPAGSGFGTFQPVYQMAEQPSDLVPTPINHAHDDWLEVWLEGGWPGVGLAAAFVAWFGVAATRAWRPKASSGRVIDGAITQAASIAVLLLMLHSIVDYPLRTTAIS